MRAPPTPGSVAPTYHTNDCTNDSYIGGQTMQMSSHQRSTDNYKSNFNNDEMISSHTVVTPPKRTSEHHHHHYMQNNSGMTTSQVSFVSNDTTTQSSMPMSHNNVSPQVARASSYVVSICILFNDQCSLNWAYIHMDNRFRGHFQRILHTRISWVHSLSLPIDF